VSRTTSEITAGYWRVEGEFGGVTPFVKVLVSRQRPREQVVWGLSCHADTPDEEPTWEYRTLGRELAAVERDYPELVWHTDYDRRPEMPMRAERDQFRQAHADSVLEVVSLSEELREERRQHEFWLTEYKREAHNVAYYRGLVDKCAAHLGPDVYVQDDGGVVDEPLRAKVPELVKQQALDLRISDRVLGGAAIAIVGMGQLAVGVMWLSAAGLLAGLVELYHQFGAP
jgi:hypothetical protein